MLKAILLATLLLSTLSFNLDGYTQESIYEKDILDLFELYLQHLAPAYITKTYDRYLNFKADVLEIIAHNNDPSKTWKKGINQFTGMTLEELEGVAIMEGQNCSATNGISASGLMDIPSSWDWRDKGVVSFVKNQGRCGSCWTFSTTGAIEAHWAIIKKTSPPDLSEQQLVDCAGDFNNHGCSGGLPSQAFEYIRYAGGIQGERNYPYKAKDEQCHFDRTKIDAQVKFGSNNITQGDEQGLLEATFAHGPVSVAFQVTKGFKDYKGGVYVGDTCQDKPETVNHAVLAVGFGHDPVSNLDYWIIKNSWGNTWGEQGYFKMKRGSNMCGVATCASWPKIRRNNIDEDEY